MLTWAHLHLLGVLSHKELIRLLCLCGFALSFDQVIALAIEADADHNNKVDYKEFVPLMTKSQCARGAPSDSMQHSQELPGYSGRNTAWRRLRRVPEIDAP